MRSLLRRFSALTLLVMLIPTAGSAASAPAQRAGHASSAPGPVRIAAIQDLRAKSDSRRAAATASALFDVFVDGYHYSAIPGVGAVSTATGVYVNVTPATSTNLELAATVTVVSALGGSHRVGIGYKGFNFGFDYNGLPGLPVSVLLEWRSFGALAYALLGSFPCSGEAAITVLTNGGNGVTTMLASRGSSFSNDDDVWVELPTTTNVPAFAARIDVCGNNLEATTSALSSFSSASVKFKEYHASINRLPNYLYVKRGPVGGYDDGYWIDLPGGADGSFGGTLQKFGITLPVTGSFAGLQRLTVDWKGSWPQWARLGLGLQYPGAYATVGVGILGGEFGFNATRESNGNIYYSNSGALDNDVPLGWCYSAFYTAAYECNLGTIYR